MEKNRCMLTWAAQCIGLLFLLSATVPSVQTQMVPISGVKTHDLGSKQRLPAAKAKVHVKIAEKHLDEKKYEGDGQEAASDDKVSSDDKVTRKDKPIEYQDPGRHASETGLLNFLLEQYKLYGQKDIEEKLEILQNLEHFSHKFENGRDLFVGTDALRTILLPALNSTSAEIRKAAASIFGIAAQNNPVVQAKSVEAGAVRLLIQLFTFDKEVRPKALFAITSILRNYPDAQKEFIQLGGVAELVKITLLPETRRRGVTFLMDLLNERRFCNAKLKDDTGDNVEIASEDPCDEQGLLRASLQSGGWCQLLVESVETLLESTGTEDQMLVIEAVESSLDLCSFAFQNTAPYFTQMLKNFDDPDFEATRTQVQTILSAITPKVSSPKVEL